MSPISNLKSESTAGLFGHILDVDRDTLSVLICIYWRILW
jgi:hypothetical protein